MDQLDSEELAIGWAIVEQLGHRRFAGYVTTVKVAGEGMLRLEIPPAGDAGPQTMLLGPGSIFAIHPVEQDVAEAAAAELRMAPVHRWELPRPAAPAPEPRMLDRGEEPPYRDGPGWPQ